MVYSVFIHPSIYQEVILKLSSNDQNRIDNLVQQFTQNPYVGDSLQIKSIREKRFDGKRIYYVVFDDLKSVLIVGLSGKRIQQRTIDSIKSRLNNYREYVISIKDNN